MADSNHHSFRFESVLYTAACLGVSWKQINTMWERLHAELQSFLRSFGLIAESQAHPR